MKSVLKKLGLSETDFNFEVKYKDNKDYMSLDTSSVNYDYTIAQKKRRQQQRQQGYELSQKIMEDPNDNQERYNQGIYY